LAEDFGFEDYAQPAGGCCFLTNEQYANKLADLWRSRGTRDYELDDMMLLKVGRHLRPKANFKVIIAREEGEGRFMEGYKKQYTSLFCASHSGPLALIDGAPDADDLLLAAQIVARYGQGRDAEQVDMRVTSPDGVQQTLQVKPLLVSDMPSAWLL
jgi:hypothetical protein